MNNRISKLGSKDYLCRCGRDAGLEKFIQTNPCQGMEPPSAAMIATAVEALLGAVWYDSGRNMQMVQGIMGRLHLT
jgi:ribonuclease-3